MADCVGQQLGNYRLVSELGRGAFAEVYLAEHLYLERLAAIKILHIQMDSEARERFRREARTIAHLHHPHIIRVLDFGVDEQTPYLVMEYTPGGTLRSQHPRGTHLSLEQIVMYVKQIASALDYAHQQHVIHRDVKPHNLLLTANYEVMLSDFGLAVVQQSLDALSLSNPTAGTPQYMAPEQIQHHPCAASDQYALGVLVYEWLAGQAPFHGSTLLEIFSHHLTQAPPSLCKRLPGLHTAVEEVVFKALAKDPEQRFACVMDFALALEQADAITQRLTLSGSTTEQGHEPSGSKSTQFVPPATVRMPQGSPLLTPSSLLPTLPTLPKEPGVHTLSVADHPTKSRQVKPSLAQNNRQRFLKRVRAIWIEGMLDHSLQGAALMALGLQEQLDALANPWHLVLQHPDIAPRSFPLGTRIAEVYDAANWELLILGAPGSGKTTLLLELTRDLLARAEQDAHQPIPVVFTLSSWAAKQQPLNEWMIEELITKYQLPPQLARTWIETNHILPLLDGLDEVETSKRTSCIETINTYHQEQAFLPLVVSSRSADYVQQTGRLRLSSAVTIQPLTQQQVDDYLVRGGEALWALRVALHQDTSLRELAETPLMLSILTLTYHDMPVEDLLRGGIAPTRQQIFDRYVNRMVVYREGKTQYTPEQTKSWLTRLAKHLVQQGQTVFYIERMQPDWLPETRMRQIYNRWAIRLPDTLIGILLGVVVSLFIFNAFNTGGFDLSSLLLPILPCGLMGWLLSAKSRPVQSQESNRPARRSFWHWLLEQRAGIFIGLLFFLILGPFFLLSSILLKIMLKKSDKEVPEPQIPQPSQGTKKRHIMKSEAIRNGITIGLLFGLSSSLTFMLSYWLYHYGLNDMLDAGLTSSLQSVTDFGVTGGLLTVLLAEKSVGISPADSLVWSWKSLGRSLFAKRHITTSLGVASLIGSFSGLSAALNFWLSHGFNGPLLFRGLYYLLIFGLSDGLLAGLVYWLLFGLIQGIARETIEDQWRAIPNQGIQRSARNGLVLGLISATIVWLSVGLIGVPTGLLDQWTMRIDLLTYELNWVLSAGIIGLSAGLLVGLLNGGLACLRHYVLRFLLRRNGSIPRNYPRFLDFAAKRILLRKVGGGYIFVHRLLLEYFASLDDTPPGTKARAQKQQVQSISDK
ncbi:MAG: hypothetical protein PVS3B1_21110 [Ktedonobacteraceae bacterium]